jgi:hypothetical protein
MPRKPEPDNRKEGKERRAIAKNKAFATEGTERGHGEHRGSNRVSPLNTRRAQNRSRINRKGAKELRSIAKKSVGGLGTGKIEVRSFRVVRVIRGHCRVGTL